MDAYKIVVEEVVVDLIRESGAMELKGDDLMGNLEKVGGYIRRNITELNQSEFVVLFMNDKIEKVVYVWREDDEIRHVQMTPEEVKNHVAKKG